MKFLRNAKGMSLVSVMVAIGLTGVLSLILMKLSEQQASIQKKANTDNELNEAISLFRSMIIKKSTCNATLQGLKLGDTFDELRFDYNSDKESFAEVSIEPDYNKAEKFRGTKLILREMKILDKNEFEDFTGKEASSNVIGLKVTFEKPPGVLGGKHLVKLFEIAVNVGTGELVMDEINAASVKTICETNRGGQIAKWENGEPAQDGAEETAAIVQKGTRHVGYCVKQGDTEGQVILGCVATE